MKSFNLICIYVKGCVYEKTNVNLKTYHVQSVGILQNISFGLNAEYWFVVYISE